jgi:hypothetical protein
MRAFKSYLFIFLTATGLSCNKPQKPQGTSNVMKYLTKPDNQTVTLIALRHNVDTTKVSALIQSYLDHFDEFHIMAAGKKINVEQILNPRGHYKIIDSLSSALDISKQTSASIVFDYILFTKKCEAEDYSSREAVQDEPEGYH